MSHMVNSSLWRGKRTSCTETGHKRILGRGIMQKRDPHNLRHNIGDWIRFALLDMCVSLSAALGKTKILSSEYVIVPQRHIDSTVNTDTSYEPTFASTSPHSERWRRFNKLRNFFSGIDHVLSCTHLWSRFEHSCVETNSCIGLCLVIYTSRRNWRNAEWRVVSFTFF